MEIINNLIQKLQQLIDDDLIESALDLAHHECPSLIFTEGDSDTASLRLSLLQTYCQILTLSNQPRQSLQLLTDFINTPGIRSYLTSGNLESIARGIADCRFTLHEYDLCLAQLRQIPRQHRLTKDWARMAKCARFSGQPGEEVEKLYSELRKRCPEAMEAQTYTGTGVGGLIRQLQYREAIQQLRKDTPVSRGKRATCEYMLGNRRKARVLYEQTEMSWTPDTCYYAELLYHEQDSTHLYLLGNRLLRSDPQQPQGWVAMAWYFLVTNQPQEALAIAWKAQNIQPTCVGAYMVEGKAQQMAGCPEESLDAHMKAHSLNPSSTTYTEVIEGMVGLARYKEAFIMAREMVEKMPDNAMALSLIGRVLAHSPESMEKAERLLRTAIEMDARCESAVAGLASLLVARERMEEAVELLTKSVEIIDSGEMFTRLADTLTLTNELGGAAVWYQRALDREEGNGRAREGLERVERLMNPPVPQEP